MDYYQTSLLWRLLHLQEIRTNRKQNTSTNNNICVCAKRSLSNIYTLAAVCIFNARYPSWVGEWFVFTQTPPGLANPLALRLYLLALFPQPRGRTVAGNKKKILKRKTADTHQLEGSQGDEKVNAKWEEVAEVEVLSTVKSGCGSSSRSRNSSSSSSCCSLHLVRSNLPDSRAVSPSRSLRWASRRG